MELLVGPVEVLVQLEKLESIGRLENDIPSLFISAAID